MGPLSYGRGWSGAGFKDEGLNSTLYKVGSCGETLGASSDYDNLVHHISTH